MKKSSNKGFTLVELIIVIAILAIIMLIAIPNFSGIQQRMKVRADKSTAAQIGKAVRVWYTDYTTDEILKKQIDDALSTNGTSVLSTTPVGYALIEGIGNYCAKTYLPTSLVDDGVTVADQVYAVSLSDATANAKIMVGVSHATTAKDASGNITGITLGAAVADGLSAYTTTGVTAVNYDGNDTGVAYIEP